MGAANHGYCTDQYLVYIPPGIRSGYPSLCGYRSDYSIRKGTKLMNIKNVELFILVVGLVLLSAELLANAGGITFIPHAIAATTGVR